jgi:hypothetical protein
MSMLFQNCIFDASLLFEGKLIGVDHGVESEVADVLQVVGRHVQADRAIEKHASKLEQRVKG